MSAEWRDAVGGRLVDGVRHWLVRRAVGIGRRL